MRVSAIEALDLARRFLNSVEPGIPIVVPSGSCTSMLKIFYGDLLADDPALSAKAMAIRPWVFELSQFIVNVLKVKYIGARYERAVAYHPSCHLMRELGVRDEPMTLLSAVAGIRIRELRDREECCGFGGMFSVKFPHISASMLEDKMARIRESGAEVVVANDCGCLMQIGGGLSRAGEKIEVRHLAEVLAARGAGVTPAPSVKAALRCRARTVPPWVFSTGCRATARGDPCTQW